MTPTAESFLKTARIGRLRYTPEQKKTMVAAYRASDLSGGVRATQVPFPGPKNRLFARNEMSRQKCAMLSTIVENCRRLGIHPKESLTDLRTRLPAMLAGEAPSLTPANWLKARSRKPVGKAA